MRNFRPIRCLVALLRDRRAATAIEYGLLAVLIAVAGIVAYRGLATATSSLWGNVSTTVTDAQ